MKVFYKKIKSRNKITWSGEISLEPENDDDLWCIHSLIFDGTIVTAKTERKIIIGEKYESSKGKSSSKKVERRTILMSICSEKSRFEEGSGYISAHINGRVISDHDEIHKGSYHSIEIQIGTRINITKDDWLSEELYQIDKSVEGDKSGGNILVVYCDITESYFELIGISKTSEKVLYSSLEISTKNNKIGNNKIRNKNSICSHDKFFNSIYIRISSLINDKIIKDVIKGKGGNKITNNNSSSMKQNVNIYSLILFAGSDGTKLLSFMKKNASVTSDSYMCSLLSSCIFSSIEKEKVIKEKRHDINNTKIIRSDNISKMCCNVIACDTLNRENGGEIIVGELIAKYTDKSNHLVFEEVKRLSITNEQRVLFGVSCIKKRLRINEDEGGFSLNNESIILPLFCETGETNNNIVKMIIFTDSCIMSDRQLIMNLSEMVSECGGRVVRICDRTATGKNINAVGSIVCVLRR